MKYHFKTIVSVMSKCRWKFYTVGGNSVQPLWNSVRLKWRQPYCAEGIHTKVRQGPGSPLQHCLQQTWKYLDVHQQMNDKKPRYIYQWKVLLSHAKCQFGTVLRGGLSLFSQSEVSFRKGKYSILTHIYTGIQKRARILGKNVTAKETQIKIEILNVEYVKMALETRNIMKRESNSPGSIQTGVDFSSPGLQKSAMVAGTCTCGGSLWQNRVNSIAAVNSIKNK